MMDPDVEEAIAEDGGLYCLGWYLGWSVGDTEATLDGKFTARQLRCIADYMDMMNAKGSHKP